ncbi:MAG: hypothetical protein ACOY46_09330 [Bacillota bacterium]
MRDQDRIEMYYRFGTKDWRSEKEKASRPGGLLNGGIRYLRLATLLWSSILKNLSADNKNKN